MRIWERPTARNHLCGPMAGLIALAGTRFLDAAEPANGGSEGILTTLGHLLISGGVLMIPIAFASVLMVGLALERIWSLRRSRVAPPAQWREVASSLETGDIESARARVATGGNPLARMLHAGFLHWEGELSDVSAALEDAGQREADDLQKHLPGLQGIASIAPLLGLLGTVVGMIRAFLTVAQEKALGDPERLARGIGEALVTTASGLCVAIPALVLYYTFRGRIRRLVRELDDAARAVIGHHRGRG